jgi:hypothetical protein
LAALAAGVMALGCGREPREAQPLSTQDDMESAITTDAVTHVAFLRAVNGVPAEPATDFMVGDRVAFSQVGYGAVTPYLEFRSDSVTLRIRPSVPEGASAMAGTTEHLNAGRHYTLLAKPNDAGGVALSLLVDEVAPPADGKAALRVMNAAPEEGKVDVDLKGASQALVSVPGSGPVSGFVDVAPVSGTLVVRRARAVLARVPDARLEPGRRYTVLLLGAAASPAGGHEARLIDEPYAAWPQS